ncbi:hypothetical protein DQ04_01011070 [Trypanosoma grayi]|uniref:hypothetical protein n=1 Tax=Trypanosoma grayi TaxID=71804 RepID=UPI0004F4934D|nr:hypothetical protein DQ04_01011070 [Trypanosoma grayi]KEG13424.1 hypothetical protein DQ04_01011070 [Trypanosoma grayi]
MHPRDDLPRALGSFSRGILYSSIPVVCEAEEALVVAVHAIFTAMRKQQRPHAGSVCSKRLQDRIEREFSAEYDVVVNGKYGRSWTHFLQASGGMACFSQPRRVAPGDVDWLIAPGSLRCYLMSEDVSKVMCADESLGTFVSRMCSGDLENVCRCILMEVFCDMELAADDLRGNGNPPQEEQYELGSLALWIPILYKLWYQNDQGICVRLRELERPCQQLGFHVRLRCRWTELLGNSLLLKYVRCSVLRVLLNAVGPPLESAAGLTGARSRDVLRVEQRLAPDELVVVLSGTNQWGRRPSIPGQFQRRR